MRTAPVFLTAPDEVKLKRYGKEVASETPQMRKRIKYIHLSHEIPEGERKEVAKVCSQCSARLYLEGKALVDNPQAQPAPIEAGVLPGAIGREIVAKRPRCVSECVKELRDLKVLFDTGMLSEAEVAGRKAKLLAGE